jgi:hypothetical protein
MRIHGAPPHGKRPSKPEYGAYMHMLRSSSLTALAVCLLAIAGCSSFRETLPARSATEQVLLSTAVDRAVDGMDKNWMKGKSIYVDDSNLDAYDSEYVVQRVRHAILVNRGELAPKLASAEVVLELASGSLSMDTGGFLIGVPSLEVPVPFGGSALTLPELYLFKHKSYVGKAKLLLNAVSTSTSGAAVEIPISYGLARRSFWWVLFVGPFESGDMPEEMR